MGSQEGGGMGVGNRAPLYPIGVITCTAISDNGCHSIIPEAGIHLEID